MKTKFYLHVRENGSTRTTKTAVATYVDEISIAMEVDLPDSLFQKPIIQGRIQVSPEMVNPLEINAEVEEEIKNAINSVNSVKIELVMPQEEHA